MAFTILFLVISIGCMTASFLLAGASAYLSARYGDEERVRINLLAATAAFFGCSSIAIAFMAGIFHG